MTYDFSVTPGPSPSTQAATGSSTAPRGPRDWRRRYTRMLWITDVLVLIWVVYGTQIAWFGLGNAQLSISNDARITDVSYWIASAVLVTSWSFALALADTRDHRVIGAGPDEYARIARSSLTLFGVIAIVAFLFRIELARGFLLISLPLGITLLLLARWLWRQWLVAKRGVGEYAARALVVGSAGSVGHLVRELQTRPESGYRVVGACIPNADAAGFIGGTRVPVLGSVDTITRAVASTGADTVIVTSTDELPADKVKEISWSLESGRQHLVLAPSIVDVAGPRIHTRPVAGLPLIHVETPKFSAGQSFAKRSFDLMGAAILLVLLSPLLAVVSLVVRFSSPGPVLFRQERIGLEGKPFRMLKFRTMRLGAENELSSLLVEQGTAHEPLFKIRDDPRITSVGRFLRKYSLDELPQLLNVLNGTMSLVGPRPQIAKEVALYSHAARRRLLARPGITGLWQVSGRSSLSWGQTVRLDVYYIENWSLASDLVILIKTIKTVLAPGITAH